MQTRRVVRWLLFGIAGFCVLLVAFFGFWFAVAAGSDRGSPALATEWRERLRQYHDPESARAADSDVVVVGCANGQWVFGLSQSSHGIWYRGGGTIVVKDSDGQIRSFFGHVCGGGNLGAGPEKLGCLADYYKELLNLGFTEHSLE